ncbi:MAG: CBS domain-containing protein [Gammaproteobacteria bacterium]|nr:CBS domain-containing protein [Gammaproteobacteria bacterium]MBU1415268.1 CBS domain-containing protein [Gammaproteobacteria bacterium]
MRVREILAVKGKVLYTIAPDMKLPVAVAAMSERDVGSLACFERGRMVGMLTFREIVGALHAKGAAWGSVTVAEVMVRNPLVGRPEMEVDELRRLMVEQHMRYLPIMDGQTLMGVISFHDVARAVLEEQGFENRMLKAYINDSPQEEVRT